MNWNSNADLAGALANGSLFVISHAVANIMLHRSSGEPAVACIVYIHTKMADPSIHHTPLI